MTLSLVHDDAPEPLSKYRNSVVVLPWPDFRGRPILMSIDGNGRIFDQCTAASESEVQWHVDRMTEDLEYTSPPRLVPA